MPTFASELSPSTLILAYPIVSPMLTERGGRSSRYCLQEIEELEGALLDRCGVGDLLKGPRSPPGLELVYEPV